MTQETGCCVLTLPLLTEPWQEHILETRFKIMEHLQNSLIAYELRQLKNLKRTRAYRNLMKQLAEAPEDEKETLYTRRNKMLKDAAFTEFAFKEAIKPMREHFHVHINRQIANRAASDVWRAFETHLFRGGKEVHFKRRGTLASVACEHAGNGMHYRNGTFIWSGGQSKQPSQKPRQKPIKLSIKVAHPSTDYERAMLEKECKYFRVVRKWMKTRYKYYLQFTLVGGPVQKDRPVAPGRVGLDIGTQSLAIASEKEVRLLELADRVNNNHSKLLALQRKMDASRRATNPDNYNPDGTICRGIKLHWNRSNRYNRLAGQVRELQRKNADIRKYQHTCLANYVLSLGSEIYVEQMNFKGLQRRAKETTVNAQGRYNRKKRFGKSLANKAPAMFLTILDGKLVSLGLPKTYRVDTWSFKASQYDHLSQQYRKKHLSQRTQTLDNGDTLQRDLYSAFLIMNSHESRQHTDQGRCEATYNTFKTLHDQEVHRLRTDGRPHLSSFGIA